MNITSADVRKYEQQRSAVDVLHRLHNNPLSVAIIPKPKLNKTEVAYREHLEFRKRAGEIADYSVQSVTFKLGDDCRYTPDFLVIENDRTMTFVEIKGFLRDDALVKFRAAQDKFPWFRFKMIQRAKGGIWKVIRE